jgi:hypothetical protein
METEYSTGLPVTQYRGAELIIARQAWETALRPMLFERRELFAVGNFRRSGGRDGVMECLVDRLEVDRRLPHGLVRPPLDDWVVVVVDHTGSQRPSELIQLLQPRHSHDLAVLILNGLDHQQWKGAFYKTGTLLPLEGVRVIGPRMLRLSAHESAADTSLPQDRQRWSRTVGALGDAVHRRVCRSAVTLIGAGRNGLQAALAFSALGIERLRLIDADVLKIENLDAMPGVCAGDVGRPKVHALGRLLSGFRPDLQLSCVACSATDADVVELLRRSRSDLIVTCVDDDTPRMAASLIARETLTVHLDVGTSVQADEAGERTITGDARLLLPSEGCVACVGGLADLDATLYEIAAPPGSLRRGVEQAWHEQRAGSLITINAMTVNAAVQCWLDLLAGRIRTSFWQRLRWTQGSGLETHAGPVGAGDDCVFCAEG